MAFRAISGRPLTASIATIIAAGGIYGLMVNLRIRGIPRSHLVASNDVSDSLRKSRSVREIIHIKGDQAMANSLSIEIDIPPQHEDLADDVLLARFATGFFGGLVLAPERALLQTFRLNLVRFTRLGSWSPFIRIWSGADLPKEQPPLLHSILFGTFQVIDVQLRQTDKGVTGDHNESYVDFGWGSDQAQFAGVHRFSIIRSAKDPLSNKKTILVQLQCLACNPQVDRPVGPAFLGLFHNIYSELLFREGVAEILKRIR